MTNNVGDAFDPIKILQTIDLLSDLKADALEMLGRKMSRVRVPAGEVLCREGEVGDRMFVIESGEFAVLKQAGSAGPMQVTTIGPGTLAGEMSLLGKVKRSATLKALTDSHVLVLAFDDFQAVVEAQPSLARVFLANVSRNLRRSTSVVAKLMARDYDQRTNVGFFDAKHYMAGVFAERNANRFAIHFHEARLSASTVSLAAGCSVVCAFVNDTVDRPVIEELAEMGVGLVALRCAGFNNVDLDAAIEYGVSVTRVPAYSPQAVAEHAVALMLALNRKIHRASNRVRENNFSLDGLVGFNMHGRTVGVVGTGQIGVCAINILLGFGCRILAYDVAQNPALVGRAGVTYVGLDQLFADSDIISLHAPLLPTTHHMINAAAIDKMKTGVMLINTSRGALVDTAALLDGLKARKIGYAGLDVYEEESAYFFEDLSDDILTDDTLARLLTFTNVLVTSHQAFLTREALGNIADDTLASIDEFAAGKRGAELGQCVARERYAARAKPDGGARKG
jgi:D-lactate dehydrogenase